MPSSIPEAAPLRIGFVGLGFSSLVNGATLAYRGHSVAIGDPNSERVCQLLGGAFPYREPGLEALVCNVMAKHLLDLSVDLEGTCRDRDILFLTVENPGAEKELDRLARTIAPFLTGHTLVVLKSPASPGLTVSLLTWLQEGLKDDATVGVAFAPDGFRKGMAVKQALYPERLLVGADNDVDAIPLFELYTELECPIVLTSTRSAEVSRYVAQALLATQTSLLNGLTGLCEEFGADLDEVLEGIGFEPSDDVRLGLGGGTIFRDAASFLAQAKDKGHPLDVLRDAIVTDHQHAVRFVARVRERFGDLGGLTVAVLGLAQSPFSGDERDSRPMFIVRSLLAEGARVKAFDPHIMTLAKAQLSTLSAPQLSYVKNAYEAADGADVILILTDWPEFNLLDFKRLATVASAPVLFDGRTLDHLSSLRAAGFEAHSVTHSKSKRPTPTMRRRVDRARAFTARSSP